MAATATAKTYVLIHGAALGQFIWEPVRQLPVADGHRVITLDLPGHGADYTPVSEITLDTYTQAVISAIGDKTGVVLVGHSLGGFVMAQVAESIPGQIAKLFYLAAPVVQNGQSNAEVSQQDTDSVLNPNAVFVDGLISFPAEWIQPGLCHDCTPDEVSKLQVLVRPFPLAPLLTPLKLTAARFGAIPKYYIPISQDRTVSYHFQ